MMSSDLGIECGLRLGGAGGYIFLARVFREPPLLWEERERGERVERKQRLSSCQHVGQAPPGAMACECPPCYHLPPGE